MKTLFKFLLIFIFIALSCLIAKAQYYPPDSCLDLVYPVEDSVHSNFDSVKVDTCYLSQTYKQWYANKYNIHFQTYIYMFNQKPLLMDSLYTWRDIDTQYSSFQDLFHQLENKYGNYFFKRDKQDDIDSSHLKVPYFYMYFNNYICVDSLIDFIRSNISSDSLYDISLIAYPAIISVEDPITIHEGNKIKIINNNYQTKIAFLDESITLNKYFNIELYDLIGNKQTVPFKNNNDNEMILNIDYLIPGIYILRINNLYNFKIIRY